MALARCIRWVSARAVAGRTRTPSPEATSPTAQSAFSLFAPLSLELDGGRARSEGWAHQDSNLERTGYEPVALTIELWARSPVYQSGLIDFSPGIGTSTSGRRGARTTRRRGRRPPLRNTPDRPRSATPCA